MRASILVLGPLVARFGRAIVALPGGCAIGSRPIDLHIAGLQKMGASITSSTAISGPRPTRLQGADIHFEKKTVSGTENLVMAASLAQGETILRNCAREPEVANLCELLVKMGAKIDGIGEETIRDPGRRRARRGDPRDHPRPDRGRDVPRRRRSDPGRHHPGGREPAHLTTIIEKLRFSGAAIEIYKAGPLRVVGSPEIKPQDITTSPYPGFPTDMQAQFMVLMTQAAGTSIITETIFDRRFLHVNELLRLGANIEVCGDKAIVRGRTPLSGAEVIATDLRASASLILAGLIAAGTTTV